MLLVVAVWNTESDAREEPRDLNNKDEEAKVESSAEIPKYDREFGATESVVTVSATESVVTVGVSEIW